MTTLTFIKEYLKNPKSIGSVIESSVFLTNKIIDIINFKEAKCIVEVGAGTGVFSEEIIKKMPKDSKLIIFELNRKFTAMLRKRFKDKALIIHDSIENIERYAHLFPEGKVDYFISSLPISLIKESKLKQLFKLFIVYLKKGGAFIQYQYSLKSKKIISKYFTELKTTFVFFNIPPAFVYTAIN